MKKLNLTEMALRMLNESELSDESKNFIKQCKQSNKFNQNQLNSIRKAFRKGLSLDQVKMIANPNIRYFKMDEIIQAFKEGLSNEQINFIIDNKRRLVRCS